MSRRAQITLSPEEQLDLLEEARVVVVSTNGKRGWPHSMPMWFTLREPEGSRWQQFTGNSGHPGSPHYDDLQPRWRDGLMQASAGEPPWRTLRLEPDA